MKVREDNFFAMNYAMQYSKKHPNTKPKPEGVKQMNFPKHPCHANANKQAI
jgi:hypothetical protein